MDVQISSLGWWVPEQVQTAEELSPQIGRSASWIESRSGVHRRRVSDLPMEQMAAHAAKRAIGDGAPPDLILNASLTPVQLLPDSSVYVQQALGLSGIPSFSVHASCLSFMVGLHTAAHFAAAGTYQRILLVSAEKGTGFRNLDEPESAALIGDGAAAAIVEPGSGRLVDFALQTFPEGSEHAQFRGAGTRVPPWEAEPADYQFSMNGPRIFRFAYTRLHEMLFGFLDKHRLRVSDVDLVVPHQMSGPGVEAFRRVGFSDEQLVDIVAEYGNCIAASIPMALAHAQEQGRLRPGAKVLLVGTGAGISVCVALLEWGQATQA
ncbi:MAG: ketoacyl-ACP synthase III [Myxococcales bacterium]|nr:ketoacyl-ACP synthase III [Myxococcales bacterium]